MIEFTITAGDTSRTLLLSVYDSSSTIGAKLGGLTNASAGLTCYYSRQGAAGSAVQVVLAAATKGTWLSSGFVAIDGTNMAGDYELGIPNAAIASGVDEVMVMLKGAANMVPVNILIHLTAFDLQTTAASTTIGTVTNLTNAPSAGDLTATMKTSVTTACTASTPTAAAVTGNVGGNVTGTVGDLTTTAKASVKAQVDASLGTDAIAELAQAIPAATPTFKAAVMFLYMALRNGLLTTSSLLSITNDAGTVIAKQTLSDDGTTLTCAKFVAGP